MATTEQLRKKLLNKLKELFQLDQPDLDFGFYRIMHAKAKQIEEFVDLDLLSIIASAFGQVDGARQSEAQAAYDAAVLQAREEFGLAEPEKAPKAIKAKAALDALKEAGSSESDVYDHLYRFFERYYDDGDFISRRYYARETSDKAAPFAIPYNGEEVKLHWANADQYYIKTAEYFTNFTFDLTQAAEIRALDVINREAVGVTGESLKVHFKIVDASEGEHGNIKASDNSKRFFVLYEADPVGLNEAGELEIRFEYKNLPGGKNEVETDIADQLKAIYGAKNKGDLPNLSSTHSVMIALHDFGKSVARFQAYAKALALKVPTDAVPERPLLAKYIGQYTARNTCDYFIHKDLGGFLKRELDFYIKNEVMRLDDIENADAPAVEGYLAKIKVIRKIATKLIEFLAQLEDFQKKLWLKKKFVTETNYCITLDRVPESLYPQIASCEAQREEWVKLFAIDEIATSEGDLGGGAVIGYSVPLTLEFLKANDKLVLDTRFFEESFKAALLNSIEDFDEQCDGLLTHSDNLQALYLLEARYEAQVKSIYFDPPYNTDASPIVYKNGYKHSSWVSLIFDRMTVAQKLATKDFLACVAIDDFEYSNLFLMFENSLGLSHCGTAVIRSKPQGRPTSSGFSTNHEYAVFWSKNSNSEVGRLPRRGTKADRYPFKDKNGIYSWANFRKSGSDSDKADRPKSFYPIYIKDGTLRVPEMSWDDERKEWIISEQCAHDEIVVYPIDQNGTQKVWTCSFKRLLEELDDVRIANADDGMVEIQKKYRPNQDGALPGTWWEHADYSASESGTKVVKDLFQVKDFDFPKSINLVEDNIRVLECGRSGYVLDFFAGSGTTGHAVINLNRNDSGSRKYILIEQGDYFNTVTKPRIAKVVYSTDWKDGKPTTRNTGISHCFKYIRLESYEDTLNNLRFVEDATRDRVMAQNPFLREDYMLHYQLDVETRGSASLLNIEQFANPTGYTLTVKKPGTDESSPRAVDLLETFNYLIGLRLEHLMAPQIFGAKFKRIPDPELPNDQNTKLVLNGALKPDASGAWTFRLVKGWVPADPAHPNNGQQERVLIVWRNLTGDLEQDNAVLDALFEKLRLNPRDFEYDTIFVNGSNNLPNLKRDDESWKVRLIEEEFHKRMWSAEGGV